MTNNDNIVYVYNFVLSNTNILSINGVECVTMGHDFINNKVIKHPFFGDRNKFIECISKLKGYEEGLIVLDQHNYVRENGYIVDIRI